MALFVLSLCPLDNSFGIGAFVLELSQISSFFLLSIISNYGHQILDINTRVAEVKSDLSLNQLNEKFDHLFWPS